VNIDGASISQWDVEVLCRYIGYLPQNVELFSGTIAENISSMKDSVDSELNSSEFESEKIIRAAKRAFAHDLVVGLPMGYQTQVGEGGGGLSAGQRQRIALARALYGDPKVVLLDEPNANLDIDGENSLALSLQLLKKEMVSVIVVTHRSKIINNVDKILFMQEGRVLKFGPKNDVGRWLHDQERSNVVSLQRN